MRDSPKHSESIEKKVVRDIIRDNIQKVTAKKQQTIEDAKNEIHYGTLINFETNAVSNVASGQNLLNGETNGLSNVAPSRKIQSSNRDLSRGTSQLGNSNRHVAHMTLDGVLRAPCHSNGFIDIARASGTRNTSKSPSKRSKSPSKRSLSNRHVPQINENGAIGLPCCYEQAISPKSRTPLVPARSSIELSGSKENPKVPKLGSVKGVLLAASPSRLTSANIEEYPSKNFGLGHKEGAKPTSGKAVTTSKKNLTAHTAEYEGSNREKISSSNSKFSHVKSRLMDGPLERFKPEPPTNKKPKAPSNKKKSKASELPKETSNKKDKRSTTQTFIEHQSTKTNSYQA